MGFDTSAFCGVVTSGEVTHRHIADRPDAWWQGLGHRCLHFTWGQRGAISLEGLGLEVTTDPQQAEFILAHGTEALGTSTDGSAAQPCSVDGMRALLDAAAPRRLPMIVANPDVVTVSGSELRWGGVGPSSGAWTLWRASHAFSPSQPCIEGCCCGVPEVYPQRPLPVATPSASDPCPAPWHGTTAP